MNKGADSKINIVCQMASDPKACLELADKNPDIKKEFETLYERGLSHDEKKLSYHAEKDKVFSESSSIKFELSDFITPLIVVLMVAIAYFLPAIIAAKRNHQNYMPIFILNLFLGWTGLGWLIALIWSFTAQKEL